MTKIAEYFVLAWQNLSHRKKRAYLTIIGIFIGIMAVVALVSLGQGLEQGVNEEFEKLGVDKIFVRPQTAFGGGTGPAPLTDEDVQRIERVNGVAVVAPVKYRTQRVEWGDELGFYYIAGVPDDTEQLSVVSEAFMLDVETGRMIEPGDGNAAFIGIDYTRREVFKDTIGVGSSIMINNQTFKVVGIRERIGNAADDRQIVISREAFDALTSDVDEYNVIIVRSTPGVDKTKLGEAITRALQQSRNVDAGEEDFSVDTPEDIRESFEQILSIIQVVLTGIAMISLIVGAVGIMNTMYTAVLERTKEIGIMKAVGATNNAILSIFLIESSLLGLVGGIVGVVLGLLISFATSLVASQALGNNIIQAYVSWWLVIGALLFSMIIGALAGLLPARQAANMKPVDSLRYE